MKFFTSLTWGLLLTAGVVHAQGEPAKPLTFGISPSLLKDLSLGQQKFLSEEFPLLIKDVTGLEGKLAQGKSFMEVAQKLLDGTNQFAIIPGVEFAWIQEKHPELKPLLAAIYRKPEVYGVMAVKKDSKYAKPADLKGQTLGLLRQGKMHVELFVHKETQSDLGSFFSKVTEPDNAESALDDVLLGKVQAVAIDDAGLETYKEINPGKFKRLTVIAKSERFPPGIIAYDPQKVDPKVVERFRAGLLKAHLNERSRDAMTSFRITEFTSVPAEMDGWLKEIRSVYKNSTK